VARVLIVGCGCRGRALAGALAADGHAVRGTTRDPQGAERIAAAGAEPYVGDPDRIGTLMDALAGVTILVWLLGSATGEPGRVTALHHGRLRMLFEKLVDTPVRGVVYEAAGTVPASALERGRALAAHAEATWHLPIELLDVPPEPHDAWLDAARAAVAGLLSPGRTR